MKPTSSTAISGLGLFVLFALFAGIIVLSQQQQHERSTLPYSLVTTFKGDPATSRAFAWMTEDTGIASILQIVEGTDANGLATEEALLFQGETGSLVTGGRTFGVHKAEAAELKPATTYTYRVGSGEEGLWSEPAHFTTEAASDGASGLGGTQAQEEKPFTFLNITDSQGVTEADFALWGRTLDQAFAMFPDSRFIVHDGDLTENADDPEGWKYLFDKAGRWVASVPFMPVVGNNDVTEDGSAMPLLARFNLPQNGAEGIHGSYSFDYGSAHITVLNTEGSTKEQTDWLRADLAAASKEWRIVALHRGPYGGSRYKKVADWVGVFDEFKVDLVLQGHNHEYSRSYPLRDNKVTGSGNEPVQGKAGTVYVIPNASGPKFNEKKDDQFYHAVHLQNGQQMFAAVTIDGKSLTYAAYTAGGELIDTFRLEH